MRAVSNYFFNPETTTGNLGETNIQTRTDEVNVVILASDNIPETQTLLSKQYIPVPHAIADYVIAQPFTNAIVGMTLFAIFAKYLPVVPTSILEFGRDDLKLGQNTPVVFPLLINVIPLIFAMIEIVVRTCTGSIAKKEDTDVHTPLYKIKPFTRKEAVFGFIFLMGLQVNNGITNAYPGFEGAVTDEVSRDFFSTSVLVFYGQIILAMAAYALMTKAVAPAANALMTKAIVPFFSAISGCCSEVESGCEFLGKLVARSMLPTDLISS